MMYACVGTEPVNGSFVTRHTRWHIRNRMQRSEANIRERGTHENADVIPAAEDKSRQFHASASQRSKLSSKLDHAILNWKPCRDRRLRILDLFMYRMHATGLLFLWSCERVSDPACWSVSETIVARILVIYTPLYNSAIEDRLERNGVNFGWFMLTKSAKPRAWSQIPPYMILRTYSIIIDLIPVNNW